MALTKENLEEIAEGDLIEITYSKGSSKVEHTKPFYFLELVEMGGRSDKIRVSRYKDRIYTDVILLDKISNIVKYISEKRSTPNP